MANARPLQTIYRAKGKPLSLLDIVRRLSTVEKDGKVTLTSPTFRIVETRYVETGLNTAEAGFDPEYAPMRHVDLMVYVESKSGWKRVATLVTEDFDNEAGSPEIATELFFDSAISLDNASYVLRTLGWGIIA